MFSSLPQKRHGAHNMAIPNFGYLAHFCFKHDSFARTHNVRRLFSCTLDSKELEKCSFGQRRSYPRPRNEVDQYRSLPGVRFSVVVLLVPEGLQIDFFWPTNNKSSCHEPKIYNEQISRITDQLFSKARNKIDSSSYWLHVNINDFFKFLVRSAFVNEINMHAACTQMNTDQLDSYL